MTKHLPQDNSFTRKRDLDPSPIEQFRQWLAEAVAAQLSQPYAMTLATASKDGHPAARMVILRAFDKRGFVFYTHYDSPKARDLAENPSAVLVSYWAELERQVRVTGHITRTLSEESDRQFSGYPRDTRLKVWASKQSQVISNATVLKNRVKELEIEYQDQDIPRPPFWGGFRLTPTTIEFWQGRPGYLHDRFRYTHQPDGWRIERLSP